MEPHHPQNKQQGDDNKPRFYRTGHFASKASVTVRTLRFYDRVGLLSPSQRTESGYRLYTENDWHILERIVALKFLGFSLEEIKQGLRDLRREPRLFHEALTQQETRLNEEKKRLSAQLEMIQRLQAQISAGQWSDDTLTRTIQVEKIMDSTDTTNSGGIGPKNTTLGGALKTLEDMLERDKRTQFIPLLEPSAIRQAIQIAQESYEPSPSKEGAAYYHNFVAPLLKQITEQDIWPQNASFEAFYEWAQPTKQAPPASAGQEETSRKIVYQGLGVSLELWTPGQSFIGFSLPVLDVWYGRWVE